MTVRAMTVLVALVPAGCTSVDDGRPPLARIDVVPSAILENDGFQTAVTLDGRASADPIDDPEASERLTYRWEIVGDEVRFEPGSDETDPAPVVRFRGARPATIRLTITDADGLDASATAYVRLTVR